MFFAPARFENNRAFETAAEVGMDEFRPVLFDIRTHHLCLHEVPNGNLCGTILEVRTARGCKGET